MKIRFIKMEGIWPKGTVLDVGRGVANEFINRGVAENADTPAQKSETAALGQERTASLDRGRGRKRRGRKKKK